MVKGKKYIFRLLKIFGYLSLIKNNILQMKLKTFQQILNTNFLLFDWKREDHGPDNILSEHHISNNNNNNNKWNSKI